MVTRSRYQVLTVWLPIADVAHRSSQLGRRDRPRCLTTQHTVSARGSTSQGMHKSALEWALTALWDSLVTETVWLSPDAAPLQPVKSQPELGRAVTSTRVPGSYPVARAELPDVLYEGGSNQPVGCGDVGGYSRRLQ